MPYTYHGLLEKAWKEIAFALNINWRNSGILQGSSYISGLEAKESIAIETSYAKVPSTFKEEEPVLESKDREYDRSLMEEDESQPSQEMTEKGLISLGRLEKQEPVGEDLYATQKRQPKSLDKNSRDYIPQLPLLSFTPVFPTYTTKDQGSRPDVCL